MLLDLFLFSFLEYVMKRGKKEYGTLRKESRNLYFIAFKSIVRIAINAKRRNFQNPFHETISLQVLSGYRWNHKSVKILQ